MRSNHRHKIRFQDIVYLKWNGGSNIKNTDKELNLMCKTDKKIRNYIVSIPRDKMSHRSCELIVDFMGESSEAWNRVSMIAPVKKFGRARLSIGGLP